MNERLLYLRTQELQLSQEEFGAKIGVTRAAVSRYESGDRQLSENIILSICTVFRVNYFWLTQGKGEMLSGTPQNVVDELAEDYDLDEIDKKIIEKYLALAPEKRAVLKEYLKEVFM